MEEDIRDIQEMLGVFDNITQEQLDEARRNADKEWSEMELEEDIKVLEEFIKYAKNTLNDFDYERPIEVTIWKTEIQAIENLINRNKELEEENIKLDTEIAEVVYWESSSVEQIKQDYIPKSKVREKIKKIQELIDYNNERKQLSDMVEQLEEQKDLLQELLEDVDKTPFINKHLKGKYLYDNLKFILQEGDETND